MTVAPGRGPSAGSFPRMPPRANEEKKWKRSGKFNAPVRDPEAADTAPALIFFDTSPSV